MNKKILLNRWDSSNLFKIILLILDVIVINVSSVFSMMARFSGGIEAVPHVYFNSIFNFAIFNTLVTIAIIYFCRLYGSIWRYASSKEIVYIIMASFISTAVNFVYYFGLAVPIFRSYFPLYFTFLMILTFFTRFSYRAIRTVYRGARFSSEMKNIMIIGAGDAGNLVAREFEMSDHLDAKVRCFIDDNPDKKGLYIQGIKVVGGREEIVNFAQKYNIHEIIIAIPSAKKSTIKPIIEECNKTDCKLKILPGMYQLVTGEVEIAKLKEIEIEDLLGRDPINISSHLLGEYVAEKTVLVTGAGGSIGSELSRQIAANFPRTLIMFDIYENSLYDIQRELENKYPKLNIVTLVGSIRNRSRLENVFQTYRPDIIYHAAAHKHVPLMEDSPREAVKNNVFGTIELCRAADRYEAQKLVLISTDKAVNPTNVMGATKRICEMIIQYYNNRSKTSFVAVRFGNVLGSNGSVIPYFKRQILEGGPVTVTHPEIIRYFMTIPEAVSLVLRAGVNAAGGEIFVLDMGEPVKILDLAKNMIKLSGHELGVDMEIVFTGLRPGEKLYEELLMDEEGLQKTDNDQIYIGKPLEFDEAEFEAKLKRLYRVAYGEKENIKEAVKDIVPTYHYNK